MVLDGKGRCVLGRLAGTPHTAEVEYLSEGDQKDFTLDVHPICLEVGILKSEAMAWTIEKAVELGVQKVQPLVCENTVVNLKKKGPEALVSRLERIALQSLKQCERLSALEVAPPLSVFDLTPANRFYCEERSDAPYFNLSSLDSSPIHLTIGPEGGFTPREKEYLSEVGKGISLGPRILRAETAALFSASIASSYFLSVSKT